METKHINDALDPTAIEAKSLSTWPPGEAKTSPRQGLHKLRLVEDHADADAVAEVGAEDTAAAKLPATDRPARSEFVLNPLSRRVIPYWRRRR